MTCQLDFFLLSFQLKALTILLIELAFMALVVVLVLTLAHTHKKRMLIVGILCVIFGTGMYVSPLSVMVRIMSTIFSYLFFSFNEGMYQGHKTVKWLILFYFSHGSFAENGYYYKECEIHAILSFPGQLSQWGMLDCLCTHPLRHLSHSM